MQNWEELRRSRLFPIESLFDFLGSRLHLLKIESSNKSGVFATSWWCILEEYHVTILSSFYHHSIIILSSFYHRNHMITIRIKLFVSIKISESLVFFYNPFFAPKPSTQRPIYKRLDPLGFSVGTPTRGLPKGSPVFVDCHMKPP